MQETKTDSLDDSNIKKRLQDFGLSIHMKHRYQLAKTRSGGVAVLYDSAIENITFIEVNTPDCIWFNVKLNNGQTILCCNAYVLAKLSGFFKSNIFEKKNECDLIQLIIDISPDEIQIAGDFNARTNDVIDYVLLDRFVARANGMGDEILDEFDIEDKLD